MKNNFEIRGETTAIFLNSKKHGLLETLISTTDLPRVQEFPGIWYPWWNKRTNSFYAIGEHRSKGRTHARIGLHRWILNVTDPKLQVDHINHVTLDNRRSVINIVTPSENMQNLRLYSTNTSGHVGVSWQKRDRRWSAHIKINGRQKGLGYFERIEDAIAARVRAETEHYKYKTQLIHSKRKDNNPWNQRNA